MVRALASIMKNVLSTLLVLAASLLSIPGAARAADIAFFPVEGTSLRPEDASAIGELLAQSYASVSGQAVLAPSRIKLLSPNYEQAAKEIGVAEYVRTDAVAIGQRIVIHSVRHQANGTVVFQSKMTAERIEDMTIVSDRMARALYYRVDDEAVRTRHNVTLNEARPEARRWTEKVIGFKTGLHVPFAKDSDFAPSLSGMFDMRMESDRFFIEFGAGIMISTGEGDSYSGECQYADSIDECHSNKGKLGGLVSEIGGSYFLTDGDIAPYIGGGLMPRLILSGSEDDVANLAVFGQVGVTLPRDSSTRFYIDARIAQNTLEVSLYNGDNKYPTELSLQAGVGW